MTDTEKILSEIERLLKHTAFNNGDVEHGYDLALLDVKRFVNSTIEEPVSEEFEEALASEWKAYNDRGAATVDALEDNTQELAFAKGFYRGAKWKEQKDSIVSDDLEDFALQYAGHHAPYDSCMQEVKDAVKAGANWKEQQMMTKAVEGGCFSYKNGFVHISCDIDEHLTDIKIGDKVRVIVIKED